MTVIALANLKKIAQVEAFVAFVTAPDARLITRLTLLDLAGGVLAVRSLLIEEKARLAGVTAEVA